MIRARFEIYMALPTRKVETMRPPSAIVDEILVALSPASHARYFGPVATIVPSIV